MLPLGKCWSITTHASRQLLTYSKRKESANDFQGQQILTVWQTEPAFEEPKPVVSWYARLSGDKGWAHALPWARFASDSIVLQRTDSHRILAWDIKSQSLAWQSAQESFFAPEPRLSAGGKYLLLPEDGGLRICDSLGCQVLGQVPMDGCSGFSPHPGGSLVAVINSSSLYIVDITGQQPTRKLAANSVSSPFRVNFDWSEAIASI